MKRILVVLMSMFIAQFAIADQKNGLTLDVYTADSGSFGVNATLVYGEKEALLVDTGFTKADALRIAAKVLDSKKTLKTIFISQADPDYYFGAEVLHGIFPDAEIITTAAVKEAIEKKLEGKLAFWGPKMGANAPVKPIIPAVYDDSSLLVDGHIVEIIKTEGVLAHRPYLWIPENKAVLGNVAVFGNIHPWMADAQSVEMQDAWKDQLNEMLALSPSVVIPGHMTPETKLTSEAFKFTLNYINDFQEAKAASQNSAEMIEIMTTKYPNAAGLLNLNIAAKVHKGEMQW